MKCIKNLKELHSLAMTGKCVYSTVHCFTKHMPAAWVINFQGTLLYRLLYEHGLYEYKKQVKRGKNESKI